MYLPPLTSLSRPLSLSEYYHACVGSSRFTLERPREVVLVLRGNGQVAVPDWHAAIDRVAAAHPGTRLRLLGKRRHARWQSDGAPPRLRIVDGCDWDAASDCGAGFITDTPLSLTHGPTIELIIAAPSLVILRGLHAVIDGRGGMLILTDIFRALRGEALLGSNTAFSDFDFRRSLGKIPFPPRARAASWPVPSQPSARIGDMFRRFSLGAPKPGLLARVAVALAGFVHQYTDDPVLLGLPVDLRGDVPGLRTTTNFCNLMTVRIDKGSGVADFQHRMRERIAYQATNGYPDVSDGLKRLPLPWLDLLVSRTRLNYRKLPRSRTATISNLGRIEPASFTTGGFQPADLVMLPIPGDVFATLAGMGDRVEMMLGMPKALADTACLDAFEVHLRKCLNAD